MSLKELLDRKKWLRMEIVRLTQNVEAVQKYLDELAKIERQLKDYGQ